MRTAAVIGFAMGLVAVGWPTAPVRGEDAAAREILDKVRQLDETTRKWANRAQTMTLTIQGKGGGKRERTLKIYDKQQADGEDKTVSFFLSPPEVKGTAFLQLAHTGRDADQWLYLPEVKRSRRITSNLRDQSFMGTDFSYRDLEILGNIQSWTEKDATSKLVGAEDVDGRACHVIELSPQQVGMSYRKLVMLLDKEQLVLRKMDFYDGAAQHVKTLVQSDVRDVGTIPTAHKMELKSVDKGTATVVALTEVKYDSSLPDDLFTERQLQRGAPAD
jgi:outer membrane lipoprotein-sorting protein